MVGGLIEEIDMEYEEFLADKAFSHVSAGFDCGDLEYPLFDYQYPIVRWALKRGKAAIFADTGLGKTIMQLAWADQVAKQTNGPVLLLAPLAVADQTIEEGNKYGIHVDKANPGADMFGPHLVITNYEQLHKFNPDQFQGIVLDESSILKGMDGRRRKEITEFGKSIPYRLSCTATPSPNDFMELGTQAEFLGIMSQVEMLAMFFIHDGGDVAKWRLKGHGQAKFFEWLATWSVVIRSPSDLGFDGSRHSLPPLRYHSHVIETEPEDTLFVEPAQGLQERNKARKDSVRDRVQKAAEIANNIDGDVLIWCNLNDESERLASLVKGAAEVKGSDNPDHKVNAVLWFLGYSGLDLISSSKIQRSGPCLPPITSSSTTSKTEIKELPNQKSGSKPTKTIESNICGNTQEKTEKNLEEPLSSRKNTTGKGASDTQAIKNTEKEKSKRSQNISDLIQKKDLQKDLKNTASRLTNTEKFSQVSQGVAQFVDQKTLDAQSESDCMSITAINQEELEVCSAPTAIKDLESSRTNRDGLDRQPTTSKKVLISKPRIFGYGLNLQHCNHMIFVGLSDSWESYYQAIRRCWRFGQKNEVHVHVVSADTEGAVVENIQRKDRQNKELGEAMVKHMKTMMEKEIFSAAIEKTDYNANVKLELPEWVM